MCPPSWTGLLAEVDRRGRTRYRSSDSQDRDVAENMLRDELKRKAHGLSASPDPRRTLVGDLLEALKNRYRVEGRRSLERLEDAVEHLLGMFRGVPAAQVKGAGVLRYANLRLEEKAKPATINRELAAHRAASRLGLDNDTIVVMPRIRLLPENNARQGFAEARQIAAICRRLPPDLADAVQFMFITGWRSRSEVLPLTWAQVALAGGRSPGAGHDEEQRRPGLPADPRVPGPPGAPPGDHAALRARPARIVAHVFHRYGRPIKSLLAGLDEGVQGCRPAWAPAPRPEALGSEESRARRHLALGRDEAHWPQDGGCVPPLRDRRRKRPS
jgi:hypothetical protein